MKTFPAPPRRAQRPFAASGFLVAFIVGLLLLGGAAPFAGRAGAQCLVTVNALDWGAYNASGYHLTGTYEVGHTPGSTSAPPVSYRDFFVFNVPTFTGTLSSASLRVTVNGYASSDSAEVFQLHHVSTAVPTLRAAAFGATGTYTDLGDGIVFGAASVASTSIYNQVSIPLNAAFLTEATARRGGLMAVGGHITTLRPGTNDYEILFGNNVNPIYSGNYVQLVLTIQQSVPLITIQPQGFTGVIGGSGYALTVVACSDGPLTYQWQLNGTNLPGATTSTYPFSMLSTNQAGNYTVVVSDGVNFTTSGVATVAVEAVVIYAQPSSQTNLIGESVYFSVSASAVGPLTYQWRFNGTNLGGQHNSYLSYAYATTNLTGDYSVVVSNTAGSVTSVVAHLTVKAQAPVFSYPPSSASVAVEQYVYFSALAFGGPPPTYRWYFNGNPLAGQTNTSFYIASARTNDAGQYRVVASNSSGSATSSIATLTVYTVAPAVGTPTSTINFAGGSTVFYAGVSGAPTPVASFYRVGNPVPVAVNNTLQFGTASLPLSNLSSNQAGGYFIVVSNVAGSATSGVFTATVVYAAPRFSSVPTSTTIPVGSDFVFRYAAAYGGPTPTLQWRFNGVDLPGQTNGYLQFFVASTNQAGLYAVVASNSLGSTSALATLNVTEQAPYFSPPPANATVLAGNYVSFFATALGAPPPTYQWQFNGTNLPGQTNGFLQFFVATTNQAGPYMLVASNYLGAASAVATLTVTQLAPYFIEVPLSNTVLAGGSVGLHSYASGGPLPTYQWQFQGVDLPGQTYPNLYLYGLSTNQSGEYRVIVSNSVGSTSAVATLTVNLQAPLFFNAPASLTVLAGGNASFFASAYGGPPPTLQWRFNGADLPGQTNTTLTLFNVSTNESGPYTVVASNDLGSTSAVATLTVNLQAPVFVVQPQSVTAVAGSLVEFYAVASAGPPPDYYLLWNGTNTAFPAVVSPANEGTLVVFSILDVAGTEAGGYTILASNALGTATSDLVTLTVAPAGSLDRWHRRNPLPQGRELFSVTHGAGQFLAVGESGAIVSSLDGTNWTAQSLRTATDLNGVTFGGGLFVAVGEGGVILTSPDGVTWTPRRYGASDSLTSVAYGNGHFAAVGSTIVTSTNGTTWEPQSTSVNNFNGVTFGNGLFVAVTRSGKIWTSPDGGEWEPRNSGTSAELEAVIFGNGQFVAVGDSGVILTSPNGEVWTRRLGAAKHLRGVAYGSGLYVAVGSKGIMFRSSDGVNWSGDVSGTPDRLDDVTFAHGVFIALGENGTIISSTGSGWANETSGTRRDLDGMVVGQNQIVAVGKYGTILTSADGANYVAQNAGTTNDLHGVGFGAGLFVAVGDPGVILTSGNAVDWSAQASGTSNYLKRVKYASGRWVAVGDAAILTSLDATNWTSTGVSRPFEDVAYGNGLFVAVGSQPGGSYYDGFIYTSVDGLTWSWAVSTDKGLRAVIYTNGIFLATGNDGLILISFSTSPNTVAWATHPTGFAYYNGYNLRDASYAHGLWLIVGNNGLILTSPDTVTWKPRVSRTRENLHAIVPLGDTLVTLGNRGTILQSDPLVPRLTTGRDGSNLRLTFTSPREGAFKLQESTDFNWTDLMDLNNDSGAVEQLVPLPPGPGHRFYRVVGP